MLADVEFNAEEITFELGVLLECPWRKRKEETYANYYVIHWQTVLQQKKRGKNAE